MLIQGATGPQVNNTPGSNPTVRMGAQGDLIASELHGRFYEQNYRGNVYAGGMTLTSVANATFTSATTGATATPLIALFNPLTSLVNLVVLQAILNVIITAATNTGLGGCVWMGCTGENAMTAGALGFNRKTLGQTGGVGKFIAGTAMTAKAAALAFLFGSALGGGSNSNFSQVGTAVGFTPSGAPTVENFDGSLIVPPGGIIALLAVTTPVAHSAVSGIVWEEVPV